MSLFKRLKKQNENQDGTITEIKKEENNVKNKDQLKIKIKRVNFKNVKAECDKCKDVNDYSIKFCKECGRVLVSYKFCTNCQVKNDANAKFCFRCGEKF